MRPDPIGKLALENGLDEVSANIALQGSDGLIENRGVREWE
jgi:hypothetical protein